MTEPTTDRSTRPEALILSDDPRATREAEAGGKGMNLGRLVAGGFRVPPFFVVGTAAFRAVAGRAGVREAIAAALDGRDLAKPAEAEAASEAIRRAVLAAEDPDGLDLVEVVREGLARAIPDGAFVAVRSSAVGEDSAAASFAGQMDTFLFVRGPEAAAEAVRKCWASAFGARALSYRVQSGIDPTDVAAAVVVQEMVPGEVSGVMFTACPTTGRRDVAVVSATWGLGEGLVSGELAADTFSATKAEGEVAERDVQPKERRVVFDAERGGGTRTEEVEAERREAACLDDAAVADLARLGARVEDFYGGAHQDVEWTRRGGELYLLQARPITSLPPPPAAGPPRLWDNSNIIESYSGVTTPFTYSFIKYAYSIAYQQSCEVGGVPLEVIKAQERVRRNLLGLLRGNVYYNLESWASMLVLFPFGKPEDQQAEMEQMLGVRESLAAGAGEVMERVLAARPRYTLRQRLGFYRAALRNAWRIDRLVREFEANCREGYARFAELDWDALSLHELHAVYHDMVQHFLWSWQAPLITDFGAMKFSAKLKELTVKWGLDPEGAFQNDLLCGEGGIESTEPTRHLMILAREVQRQPALREALEATPDAECLALLEAREDLAGFRDQVRDYLKRYGFRCMNELKLEEPSLREEPAFVFTVVKNYLKLAPAELEAEIEQRRERQKREAAEQVVRERLGFFKRRVYGFVLRQTRKHVKNRENMRFARTRVYGMVRELVNAMGRRLEERGELERWRDVYYLTVEELMGFVDGTTYTTDLKGTVAVRKAEYERYRAEEEPDDRVITLGAVHAGNAFKRPREAVGDGSELRGTPCCPGVVRSVVRVIRSPKDDMSLDGEILVAARTDPGWVPLYPSASGLLIERGSLLSHSAIVARERGLPAIVNIPDLCRRLEDGMVVEMDAAKGIVRIVEEGDDDGGDGEGGGD